VPSSKLMARGSRTPNHDVRYRSITICIASVVVLAMQLIAQVVSLDPAKMPTIGTVDERFQSYNIEMVEVIGGRFWKPYGSNTSESKAQEPAPRRVSLRQA